MQAVPSPPDGEIFGGAVHHRSFKLNKETFREILGKPLPGIDEVQLVVVHIQPFGRRCVEQLVINITGSLMAAAIAFGAGVYIGAGDNTSKPPIEAKAPVQITK